MYRVITSARNDGLTSYRKLFEDEVRKATGISHADLVDSYPGYIRLRYSCHLNDFSNLDTIRRIAQDFWEKGYVYDHDYDQKFVTVKVKTGSAGYEGEQLYAGACSGTFCAKSGIMELLDTDFAGFCYRQPSSGTIRFIGTEDDMAQLKQLFRSHGFAGSALKVSNANGADIKFYQG